MSNSAQSARDDLAFMRSVVQDRGPLPGWIGAHLFAGGLAFGLNLIVAGIWFWPSTLWAWLPASLLYVPLWFLIHARSDYAGMGPSARVFGAAWLAVIMMTAVIVGSLATAQVHTGAAYAQVWPAIAAAIYGGAWMVGALIRRRLWMGIVGAGCFATALACAATIGQPQMLIALGAGLLAFIAVPGLVVMRLARREG